MTPLRERYLETVFGYALRRLGSRDDAEDATVETFAAAYAHIARCPKPTAAADYVKAWLLGIARHKVADILRQRRRRREVPLGEAGRAIVPAPDRAVRAALDSLRPVHREVLLLKYGDGLSLLEIARVLGKSEAAVSSLLQRARATAQERIGQEETEAMP